VKFRHANLRARAEIVKEREPCRYALSVFVHAGFGIVVACARAFTPAS
jgi:hypothetical protein